MSVKRLHGLVALMTSLRVFGCGTARTRESRGLLTGILMNPTTVRGTTRKTACALWERNLGNGKTVNAN